MDKLNSNITSNTKLNKEFFQKRDNKIDEIIDIITDAKITQQVINAISTVDFDNIINRIDFGIIISQVSNAMSRSGAPSDAYGWGFLITFKSVLVSNSYANFQIYFPDSQSQEKNIYFRSLSETNKNTWKYINISGTVSSVENS